MKDKLAVAQRVHPRIIASLTYSFETPPKKTSTVDLFSAPFVKRSHVYLSGDFHRWRTGGRSCRPEREWRALCSCPACEPTRPLRGHSSRATKRTLRCELLLKQKGASTLVTVFFLRLQGFRHHKVTPRSDKAGETGLRQHLCPPDM